MARRLATLEAVFLFATATGVSLLWRRSIVLDSRDVVSVLVAAAVIVACCIVAFYYNDLYDLRTTRNLLLFGPRLVQSMGVAFILLAGFYTVSPELRLADGAFVSTILVVVGLLLPFRAAVYGALRRRALAERVVVLGSGSLATQIVNEIDRSPHCGLRVVGVASDDTSRQSEFLSCEVFAPLDHFSKIVEEAKPQRIIVALRDRRGVLPVRELLSAQMNGVLVQDGVELYERLTGKVAIEALTPSHLIFSSSFRRFRRRRRERRTVNFLLGIVGLLVSLPFMAVVALAIRLDSRGPIFFIQPRCGVGGRTFNLIKFRTMYESVDHASGSVWCRDDESRVTRVGKWLRKLRLDELPQFWNLVKGDMAIIGPRPEIATNVAAMTAHIPYYALRHCVPPGITGWAQIKQGYSVDLEEVTEKMRYDLYYIKNMSLWFDVRILVDTVKIVLFGRGSR